MAVRSSGRRRARSPPAPAGFVKGAHVVFDRVNGPSHVQKGVVGILTGDKETTTGIRRKLTGPLVCCGGDGSGMVMVAVGACILAVGQVLT